MDISRVLVGCALVLIAGTIFRLAMWWRRPQEPTWDRLRSMGTWWILYLGLALSVLGGPRAAVVLLALLSVLGIWEYRRLTYEAVAASWPWPAVIVVTLAHYLVLYFGAVEVAKVGTPLIALLLLVVLALLQERAAGFLRVTAIPLWGWILIAYCPAHGAMVALGGSDAGAGGHMGRFLFLVLLTELHDIAQAMWGRALGKRKITPKISPGKTWEGLLLGTATTVGLAALFAPLLLQPGAEAEQAGSWQLRSVLLAASAGLVIAISGFVGDITMSALKRDCGVKDSSKLLPGQGGILDRIDSLTLAAPAFYYYMLTLAGPFGR